MKRYIAVVACLTLAACASEPHSATNPALAKAPGTTCELVYVTGSSLPKNVCRTAEEKAQQSAAAQVAAAEMRQMVDQRKERGDDK